MNEFSVKCGHLNESYREILYSVTNLYAENARIATLVYELRGTRFNFLDILTS